MFKTVLTGIIKDALAELGIANVAFLVEHPTVIEHGDFATNAAMAAAKIAGKNPRALAEELVQKIAAKHVLEIASISIAGPGFINFALTDSAFRDEVARIDHEREDYGKGHAWDGRKLLVEHSSPNLFKPFHIGHLMNNAVGESIARLARFSGATVFAISFPSDVSLGIAKAVAVMEEKAQNDFNGRSQTEKLKRLGEWYAEGSRRYDEDGAFAAHVRELSARLYAGERNDFYADAKQTSLLEFERMVKKLGSHFDAYIFESETGKKGEELVRAHIGDVFKESEGAVIYEGEQDGLHTRVFINKEGHPTYEAKDIGLLALKFSRFQPDLSLFITDHEQKAYFEVVATAAGKINPEWKAKTIHRTHGRMTFKGQKLSSRLGGVPLASDIIGTLTHEVLLRAPHLAPDDAEIIAIGAIKFAILRAAAGKNINFDPDTSLSFEGDSGPYLQYTCVRARSVLAKAAAEGHLPDAACATAVPVVLVEKMLVRFPEVVELAIAEWAPHHVATYLLELAQAYNSWYGNTKIIDSSNPAMAYNLALTKAVADVIARGLDLLGIVVPMKM